MALLTISKHPTPLQTILDEVLTPDQRMAVLRRMPERTYVAGLGTYSRAMPSMRGKAKFIIWDKLPESAIAELRSGQADLLLDMSLEALPVSANDWRPALDEICAAAQELGIAPSRLVFANSNVGSPSLLAGYRPPGGRAGPRVLAADFSFMFFGFHGRDLPAQQSGPAARAPKGLPSFAFLCMNRKIKLHRLAVVAGVLATTKKGSLNYSLLGTGLDSDRAALTHATEALPALLPHLHADGRLAPALVQLRADFPRSLATGRTHDAKSGTSLARSTEPREIYRAALLSIVPETLFSGPGVCMLTEKSFKPMLMQHPMVVVGDAGTLARLRHLGFQTFGAAWDEGYDEIEDPVQRMQAVLEVLVRIAEAGPVGWRRMRSALADAIRHNERHLRVGLRDRFAETLVMACDASWPAAEAAA